MKIPTEVRLCWDFFLGGALVSSAPTAQKCTIYFVGAAETAAPPGSAPTAQKCTIYLVGAAETAAPPGRHRASTALIALTIRGYVGVRGYGRDAIPSYNSSP